MNYVILAGGTGTRLWPKSRNSTPKQLSQLASAKTMIEDTVERLEGIADASNLYISTNAEFAKAIQKILPEIAADHYIIEPEKRDTGPAMGYVAAHMMLVAPDEPMAFLASDHYIRDPKMYRDTFLAAEKMIRETGKLLDIAITPTFPNTNLGYTIIGKLAKHDHGIHFYEFAGHVEKPNYETAKKFLADANYLWHANYYMWTPRKFLEAYDQYAPATGALLRTIVTALEKHDTTAAETAFKQMEKISFDYAITEKMNPTDVFIIRGEFGWADLGDWGMLYDELNHQTDQQGNLVQADWVGIDTSNTLIYGTEGRVITTIGLSDMVIVDTPDALLVAPQGRAQDVKKIVEQLKEKGYTDQL